MSSGGLGADIMLLCNGFSFWERACGAHVGIKGLQCFFVLGLWTHLGVFDTNVNQPKVTLTKWIYTIELDLWST